MSEAKKLNNNETFERCQSCQNFAVGGWESVAMGYCAYVCKDVYKPVTVEFLNSKVTRKELVNVIRLPNKEEIEFKR